MASKPMPAPQRDAPDGAPAMSHRFRGFLPVVVDIETGGLNPDRDALLEIAAVALGMDQRGLLYPDRHVRHAVAPSAGANIDEASLQLTGIDPTDPARGAIDEADALRALFQWVRAEIAARECSRAILVGHNAHFDHQFISTAARRSGVSRNPFHLFSVFDTVSLAGVALGETVLARACAAASIPFDAGRAHNALYDAEKTAALFCLLANQATLSRHAPWRLEAPSR